MYQFLFAKKLYIIIDISEQKKGDVTYFNGDDVVQGT